MGGQGEGHDGRGLFEAKAGAREGIETRGLRGRVAVAAEMVGAGGVEGDEQQVAGGFVGKEPSRPPRTAEHRPRGDAGADDHDDHGGPAHPAIVVRPGRGVQGPSYFMRPFPRPGRASRRIRVDVSEREGPVSLEDGQDLHAW